MPLTFQNSFQSAEHTHCNSAVLRRPKFCIRIYCRAPFDLGDIAFLHSNLVFRNALCLERHDLFEVIDFPLVDEVTQSGECQGAPTIRMRKVSLYYKILTLYSLNGAKITSCDSDIQISIIILI